MTESASSKGYVFRGDQRQDRMMVDRSASVEAAFVLPFLKPGQAVADFGCGQGTITVGFAEAVAPGRVLGFDAQVEHGVAPAADSAQDAPESAPQPEETARV